MKKIAILVLAGVIFLVLLLSNKSEEKIKTINNPTINQVENNVTGLLGEDKIFSYVYDPAQYKPYIKELYSPGGLNVLLDSPDDHKHHHALMYAIKVDGTNFWEEVELSGKQVPQNTSKVTSSTKDNKTEMSFSSQLKWIRPQDEGVLLLEDRTIQVEIPADKNVTLLTWTSELSVPEGKEAAELGGNHYHGLGMRFIRSMDEHGEFFTAHNRQGEIFRGEERLIPDDWCAYTAKAGSDQEATVAMFRSPQNMGENTIWFTMKTPFAYVSATKAWHETPYTLKAGEILTLTYGVAVWDGKIETDEINRIYKYWKELL